MTLRLLSVTIAATLPFQALFAHAQVTYNNVARTPPDVIDWCNCVRDLHEYLETPPRAIHRVGDCSTTILASPACGGAIGGVYKACGDGLTIQPDPSYKLKFTPPCPDGCTCGEIEVTIPVPMLTLSSGPCEKCWITPCYDDATVSITQCWHERCVEWRYLPLCGPGIPARECVRTELYATCSTTYDLGPSVTYVRRCEPYRCANCPPAPSPRISYPTDSQPTTNSHTGLRLQLSAKMVLGEDYTGEPIDALNIRQLRQLLESVWLHQRISESSHPNRVPVVEVAFADQLEVLGSGTEARASLIDRVLRLTKTDHPYDVNLDGHVDFDDYLALAESYSAAISGGDWKPAADIDGDGAPGPADFCLLSTRLFQ